MHWPVENAGSHLIDILKAALKEGPQIITKEGVEVAVLVAIDEWKRVKAANDTKRESDSNNL